RSGPRWVGSDREPGRSAALPAPDNTSRESQPIAAAPPTSVSSRSPTTRGWAAPAASAAAWNRGADGLPTTVGAAPVVVVTAARSAPAPGQSPSGAGYEASAFVATSLAPRSTRSEAVRSFA